MMLSAAKSKSGLHRYLHGTSLEKMKKTHEKPLKTFTLWAKV
jgi:hypothetical protein